jgi:hypothetical protein
MNLNEPLPSKLKLWNAESQRSWSAGDLPYCNSGIHSIAVNRLILKYSLSDASELSGVASERFPVSCIDLKAAGLFKINYFAYTSIQRSRATCRVAGSASNRSKAAAD